MKINRNDNLYVEIDKIENHSAQYQVFLTMMRWRLFYNGDNPKENQDEYIKWAKIKESDLYSYSIDREFYEQECKNEIGMRKVNFIIDYAYFNKINYQLYVNIDFSLPKEMLIEQISQLKDDIDKDDEMQSFFQSRLNLDEAELCFIPHKPTDFAKVIKRQYGDFLFILDCKKLGYTNQEIMYSIYDFRKDKTTISKDTIRKYLKIAQEVYESIEEAQ